MLAATALAVAGTSKGGLSILGLGVRLRLGGPLARDLATKVSLRLLGGLTLVAALAVVPVRRARGSGLGG